MPGTTWQKDRISYCKLSWLLHRYTLTHADVYAYAQIKQNRNIKRILRVLIPQSVVFVILAPVSLLFRMQIPKPNLTKYRQISGTVSGKLFGLGSNTWRPSAPAPEYWDYRQEPPCLPRNKPYICWEFRNLYLEDTSNKKFSNYVLLAKCDFYQCSLLNCGWQPHLVSYNWMWRGYKKKLTVVKVSECATTKLNSKSPV